MSRVPGRATSLASVGLILGSVLLVAALGAMPAVTPSSSLVPMAIHDGGPEAPRPRAPTYKPTPEPAPKLPAVVATFKCPLDSVPGTAAPGHLAVLTSDDAGGPPLTATTFCRDSEWFVSERTGNASDTPFLIPFDPPLPLSVSVERFIPTVPHDAPALLVERDDLGSASLFELFNAGGGSVEPVVLVPAESPILFLRAASLIDGAGFSCSPEPGSSGDEAIRQFEWYIVNPTTLKTTSTGKILGNPAVFLQTTIYTARSAGTFAATTLPIAETAYRSVEALDADSC